MLGSLLTMGFYILLYSANPIGVQSWYTAHIWVPSFIVMALWIEAALASRARTAFEAVCLGLVGLNVIVFMSCPPVYAWQAEMRREGLLLGERTADGTLAGAVGWPDAGIVGFYEGGHVINLDGLANDEIAAYLPGRLPCYLLAKHIRYVRSFGAAAEQFLHPPGPASFARRMTLRANDGYTIDLYEVDEGKISELPACR